MMQIVGLIIVVVVIMVVLGVMQRFWKDQD